MAPNGSLAASQGQSLAERRYSQIEKEGLSIAFGVKKFHQYIHGHHFTTVFDHKPLPDLSGEDEAIPPIVSLHIQRWALIQ
ncbi:RNase H-like domain-containing protein, partial [Salmonella enterica subsp. enterica serovar 1,4,[5],12:i:-]|nr:RNase H-like domain-containing protein [Salmonella enterica subsp. enterica serovar 1,4,[5],12:i:-]